MAELQDAGGVPHFHGHRERLRTRFRQKGPATLADYELLEMALYRAIQRGDTKPVAKALLKRFGNLSEILGAPRERLKEVSGVGDRVVDELKLIKAFAERTAGEAVMKRPVLSSWSALLDYCRTAMAFEEREQFYPREVMRRALELTATAIILVHNHPSGDPSPSRADIQMTKTIIEVGKPLGVAVHDHLIIGREGHVGFKGQALM
jgi:DNA repair protein RadC